MLVLAILPITIPCKEITTYLILLGRFWCTRSITGRSGGILTLASTLAFAFAFFFAILLLMLGVVAEVTFLAIVTTVPALTLQPEGTRLAFITLGWRSGCRAIFIIFILLSFVRLFITLSATLGLSRKCWATLFKISRNVCPCLFLFPTNNASSNTIIEPLIRTNIDPTLDVIGTGAVVVSYVFRERSLILDCLKVELPQNAAVNGF